MLLLLLLGAWAKFGGAGSQMGQVSTFRGANLDAGIWNPLIAGSVNEKEISVLVDNREINTKGSGIFMDENLSLMLPVSLLRDSFNCGAHLYGGNELLIEKRDKEISFVLDEPAVTVNKEKHEIGSSMVCRDGEYYVPADAVSECLDFTYEWDVEQNQARAMDNTAGASILPARYDLRERQRMPLVKDQGKYGTCWAFAALSAMESALMPEESPIFSPDHMSIQNHFYLEQADGGNYTMGMAYLLAWEGPVYEAQDPYGDHVSPDGLQPVKHVQEIQIIELKDYEKIKEAVLKYGGVQTSIYSAVTGPQPDSEYYNSANSAYCYMGSEAPNHDVLIIGWDDHYSRENFNTPLEGDGAFICQNSWGEQFGEGGVFYISYYDVNIGSHNVVYTGIEDTDNYASIHQSDLCGWVGQLGYGRDSIYGANVYLADRDEDLQAAGFYALGKDTGYELFVVPEFTGTDSLSQARKVAEGHLGNAGYYTVPFDVSVPVQAGKKFAVVLHITTPGTEKPLAIEFAADEFTSIVDLADGEAYISVTGRRWESLEETQESNLCLKAYGNWR